MTRTYSLLLQCQNFYTKNGNSNSPKKLLSFNTLTHIKDSNKHVFLCMTTLENLANVIKSFFIQPSNTIGRSISPTLFNLLFILGVTFTSFAQLTETENNNNPIDTGVQRLYQNDTFSGVVTDVGDIDYWQISKSEGATGQINYSVRDDVNFVVPGIYLEKRSGSYNGTLVSTTTIYAPNSGGSSWGFQVDYDGGDFYYLIRVDYSATTNNVYALTMSGFTTCNDVFYNTGISITAYAENTLTLNGLASHPLLNANNERFVVSISDANSFPEHVDGFMDVTASTAYSGSGSQVVYTSTDGTNTNPNIVVTGLTPGTEYFIKATVAKDCSGYLKHSTGVEISGTTCGATPNQVTNVVTEGVDLNRTKITSFTAPSGTVPNAMSLGYVVKMNVTNSFTTPTSGASLPTANTVYAGGEQVVYAGTSVTPNTTVTNLTTGTTYYIKVYAAYLCSGTYYYETVGADATMVTCINPPDGGVTSVGGQHVTGDQIYVVYFMDSAKADGTITYINDANSFTAPTATSSLPTGDLSWNNNGQQVIGTAAVTGGQYLTTNLDPNTQYYTRTYAYTLCNGVYRFNTTTPVNLNFTTCNFSNALASAPVFGTITNNTMELTSFTGLVPTAPEGNPTGYVIRMNTTNSFSPQAVRTALPTGDLIYVGGEQVVYAGTSTSPNITISGLTANTEYFFSIEAYFDNCDGGNIYQQTGYQFSKSNDATLTDPTITFSDETKNFGDADFNLNATSNSAGAISYQIISDTGGGTTLSGTNNQTVTLGNVGTVIIEANQAANGVYAAGTQTMTLTINPVTPTFSGIPFYDVADATTTLDLSSIITSNSTGAMTYSIVGADLGYTITGNILNLNDVEGGILIKTTQAASGGYLAAEDYVVTYFFDGGTFISYDFVHNLFDFSIDKGASFTIQNPRNVAAGMTITYSIISDTGTGSSITGNVFTAGNIPGTVVLRAENSANSLYNATQKDVTVTVNGTPQTITFGALADKTVGDANFTLTGSSDSGLPVSYTSSNTAVATVSGNTVTIVGAGTTNITASQSGDATYSPATDVVQPLTVNKGNQVITFEALADKTIGDADFSLTGNSDAGLTVSYTSSNTSVATVSGNTVTIVGVGMASITASQTGNANYNAAVDVVQSLTVNPITVVDQTVSASPTSGLLSVDATVSLASTQNGVGYYLRDDSNNNIIEGPIAGTGSGISFTNEVLTATKTFNVVGVPDTEPLRSLQLDNVNDFGSISNTINSSLNTNHITVETWAYIPAADDTDNHAALVTQEFNANGNLGFSIYINEGKMFAGFYRSWAWYRVLDIDYPRDQWIHIAATYDQANIKLYINGVEVGSVVETGALPIATSGLGWRLGRRWDSAQTSEFLFGGALAQTRIWNVARTQVEISANMNNTLTSETGLVTSYRYDHNSGTTVSDITGNGHDATLNSAAGDATTWVTSSNAVEMSVTPTVTVEGITDQTVSVSPTSGICSVEATVSIASSQAGIDYYIRDHSNNIIIEGPVAGTGSGFSFANETLTGTKTYNVYAVPTGERINTLQFDGTTDHISIPNTINTDLNTNHITLETWAFIPSSDDTDNHTMIMGQEFDGSNIGMAVFITNGELGAGFFSGGWSQLPTKYNYPKDQWIHIAVTYDQVNLKLYINGAEERTVDATSNLPVNNLGWRLGRRWDGVLSSEHLFGGKLAETRIWNVARTSAEITANMNKSVSSTTSLVVSYPYVEGTGNTLTDYSGNNHHGTLTNMVGDNTNWIQPSTSLTMTNTPSVTVNAIADQTVNLTQPTTESATVSIANSQVGVNYTLRDNADNTVIETIAGTGSGLSFATETITADKTYNVFAESGTCNLQLTNTPTASYVAQIVVISPKVFLQGAALNPNSGEETLMRDNLRSGGYLPIMSPYSDSLTCDTTVLNNGGTSGTGTINDDIVDWVWIELRDETDNTLVKGSRSALLQRDGDVVDVDGLSNIQIEVSPGNYHIAVKHRNHLSIMTANTLTLSGTVVIVDFTDSNNQITWGTNAQSSYGMPSNVAAMWGGNTNGDTNTAYLGSNNDSNTIKDNVLAHSDNTSNSNLYSYNDYDVVDVNMDGTIRYQGAGNDTNVIKDIVISHPENTGSSPNLYNIGEKLPEN